MPAGGSFRPPCGGGCGRSSPPPPAQPGAPPHGSASLQARCKILLAAKREKDAEVNPQLETGFAQICMLQISSIESTQPEPEPVRDSTCEPIPFKPRGSQQASHSAFYI